MQPIFFEAALFRGLLESAPDAMVAAVYPLELAVRAARRPTDPCIPPVFRLRELSLKPRGSFCDRSGTRSSHQRGGHFLS